MDWISFDLIWKCVDDIDLAEDEMKIFIKKIINESYKSLKKNFKETIRNGYIRRRRLKH